MSRVICPKCGNTDVSWIRDDAEYAQYVCLECKQDFYYPPKTIFRQITASEEVLAEKLVHIIVCEEDTSMRGWTSNIVLSVFETYEEAFAATLAKLKEVAK